MKKKLLLLITGALCAIKLVIPAVMAQCVYPTPEDVSISDLQRDLGNIFGTVGKLGNLYTPTPTPNITVPTDISVSPTKSNPTSNPLQPTAQLSRTPTQNQSQKTNADKIVDSAQNLIDIFSRYCAPEKEDPPILAYVRASNNCYYKIYKEPIISTTQAGTEIAASINYSQNQALECVGFAKAVSAAAGYSWDVWVGDKGAKALANQAPTGFTFIKKGEDSIQPGDFPIWSCGKYGHVAVVVNVNENGNDFDAAESNFGPAEKAGNIAIRPKVVDDPSDPWANCLLGWYRKI